MLSINNLTYHIGNRCIFDDASLFIKPNNKIGLVGLNGVGKSTLLKIIVGEIIPDKVKINKNNDCSIGFLNQDMLSYNSSDSILSVAMQAFEKTVSLQKKIDAVIIEMEKNYKDSLVIKLSELQEEFSRLGGYEAQSKAEKILEGVGFSTEDLQRPINEFSGGWRMRVALAKLILQEPSILMLDEPTNHLDIVSIQWIEGYLKNYPGAIIVISHDRTFLDNIINTTIEVANKKLNYFAGNYSFYEVEKNIQNELNQKAFVNQQKKIKQTEDFINRFRAKASKAKQVQSRVKALDKIDKIEDNQKKSQGVNLKLEIEKKPGKEIVSLKSVCKSYDDLEIFKNLNAKIERGDKIALIGANGKGKSTLLEIIAQTQKMNSGEVIYGHNVEKVFYAQHQLESLNLNNSIYEEILSHYPNKSEATIRKTLGAMLFVKDDVKKKIKVLSGGEKARVALAKIMLSSSNFMILDEPTNHLDMVSIDILCNAFNAYEGSFILVSHNRYFIEKLANKIWYIENMKIKEYPDNYKSYEYWLKNQKNN